MSSQQTHLPVGTKRLDEKQIYSERQNIPMDILTCGQDLWCLPPHHPVPHANFSLLRLRVDHLAGHLPAVYQIE